LTIQVLAFPTYPPSKAPRSNAIPFPKFIDAAGLGKTALIAHSRSGGFAIQLALEDPSRYSHVIILGTGSLLPLQTEAQVGRYEAVQARVDKEMAQKEPTWRMPANFCRQTPSTIP
jgi:pimeloyl-ACP methyl ester carboxylesterase